MYIYIWLSLCSVLGDGCGYIWGNDNIIFITFIRSGRQRSGPPNTQYLKIVWILRNAQTNEPKKK